jgi:beta-phosphoglucomutase-like phosphatase (HAD superfamily)
MEKCGIQPWETIVVENAPLGVRAAVAAQCFTIAVNTGPLPDEMLMEEGANLIFPQMTALAQAFHQWYPSACRAE